MTWWLVMVWFQKDPRLRSESFPSPLSGPITWHRWLRPATGSQRELSCFTAPASCLPPLNVEPKVSTLKLKNSANLVLVVNESFSFVARERCETAEKSVMLSEKATSERMKRRGLHHPLTRDSILLRVNAVQKAQCMDEVSINMECNARLRDSWGPHPSWDPLHPRRAKTCVPILKRAASQNLTKTILGRDVSTAPDTTRRPRPCLFPKKAQPHSAADTHGAVGRVGGFTTSATEGPRAPGCMLTRSPPNPERSMKTSASLPKIGPVGPFRAGRIQAAHGDPAGRLCPGQEGTRAELRAKSVQEG